MMHLNTDKKQTKELNIHNEWCKGCGICVEFCPRDVLEVKKGKSEIVKLENCVKCGICEKLCPDYVLYFVERN
jgi:2-oxoglutarate ferredoxin oxidoreductase subunit delta